MNDDRYPDPYFWRVIEVDSSPVAAIYFNGKADSLSVYCMEGLTKLIREYISNYKEPDPIRTYPV